MAKLNFRDKWILVTGASSGLGREIARYLATKEKANLVIAARRKERLENLKKEIESSGNTRVEVVKADISTIEGVDQLFKKSIESANIYAVVNDAGITFYGISKESNMALFEEIININLLAMIRLSLKFLSYFQEKGGGAILNITSAAAFMPITYQTVYSASKHAAQAFTEGLHMEYRKSGIAICSFAPGGIATEMVTTSGLTKKHSLDNPFNMKADVVARKAVKAFKKKKFVSVPGFFNKLTAFFIRFVPRKWLACLTEIIYRLPV